ncbi:MAG: C_GCAxxG_C_C family protein [Ruminococcaceae bacterium]|nr:C_GCAxxG_C_C family protein [Oscillospiraceae bacterium]
MKHSDIAVNLFLKGANCSQAVFASFGDITGFDEKTSFRLASSFGGGISRLRETCGACLGMCLAAGAIFGYDDIADRSAKTGHYAIIQGLVKKFAEINGSYTCREILGAEGKSTSPVPGERTAEYYSKRVCCIDCIRTAAEILDEYLEQNGKI